jgi:hypothetical protein
MGLFSCQDLRVVVWNGKIWVDIFDVTRMGGCLQTRMNAGVPG